MTAAYYKCGNNNEKPDNNEGKVYLLLRRWVLVGYILDCMLDQMLDQVLDHIPDYILDHIIIVL